METMQTPKEENGTYTIEDAKNVLFSKMDEAIEDMENGRVLTAEELWKELDTI